MTGVQDRPVRSPQDHAAQPLPAPAYARRHVPVRVVGGAAVALLVAGGVAATVPPMVEDAEHQVLTLPDGTVELVVLGDAGDVDVRAAAPGEEPVVTATKHWSFREPTPVVTTRGGVATVSLDCPPAAQFAQCYADWQVAVPAEMPVTVRASVGEVDVTGLTGDVTVDGSVGDVTVTGAPTSLQVTTSVGQISASLAEPPASVELRTGVGDVQLRLPDDATYDVRATATLDPAVVEVENDPASEHEVRVSSSVGSVLVTGG